MLAATNVGAKTGQVVTQKIVRSDRVCSVSSMVDRRPTSPILNSSMQMLGKKCLENESVRRTIEEWVEERLSIRRKGEDEFHLQPHGARWNRGRPFWQVRHPRPSTYYEKMAFVQVAHSKEAYFNLIEMSLKNTVEQSFEQRCSAYAAYWVAETFGLHKTNFTPIPSDFLSWVDEDPLPYGRRRTLRCF